MFEEFYKNRLLFGDPAEPNVVAVEVASDSEVEIFRRTDGKLGRERRPLNLFLLLADLSLLKGFSAPHETVQLAGDFTFRYMARFPGLAALEKAKRHLRKATGKAPNAPEAPYFVLSDPVEQYLMLTAVTNFIGMEFSQLRRLQLDIETYISAGFEFPNPERPGDRIVAIAIRDSTGFERVISGREFDERAMLEEMVRILLERDPDVIEGHNLFRFDLPYIEHRARRCGVKLALGRDGRLLDVRPSRLQIGERAISYRRYNIYGRNIIDTWVLSQLYDLSNRELEGFGLKELARHFNLAAPDREYIDASKVSHYFDHEPETLFRYALDDVRETAALAEVLCGSYFAQAQIFPYSYQTVTVRGNATKIDALLMRSYLHAGHSIPLAGPTMLVGGGFTEIRRLGVAHGVLHCDVTSLYPSLMLHYRQGPANDPLGIFLALLRDLTELRVKAKTMARELTGQRRHYVQALQQTFKILINSFYGYLGFSLGHFNDFAQANQVTARGRDLVRSLVAELEARKADVIEVDTDGIYFVAPFPLEDQAAEVQLLRALSLLMPEGVRLEIDGRYAAMFSYKMKNYVLLDASGQITVRGSSLRSRGLERFQRTVMAQLFRMLLTNRRDEIEALFESFRQALVHHELDVRDLAKTETLGDSPEVYRDKVGAKRRNVSAAYELALRSGRPYSAGDQISYYVAGSAAKPKVSSAARLLADYDPAHPDENVTYYLGKLNELHAKFKPYIEREGLFAADVLTKDAEPEQEEIFAEREA
jgi:DNA polymerase elongation subunit (family B)